MSAGTNKVKLDEIWSKAEWSFQNKRSKRTRLLKIEKTKYGHYCSDEGENFLKWFNLEKNHLAITPKEVRQAERLILKRKKLVDDIEGNELKFIYREAVGNSATEIQVGKNVDIQTEI